MKDINISKIISDNRRRKGVTQDQLAEYIGVSKASVSKWETGHSYPDITFLAPLATYFNMSIDELMGYSPQMTKEEIKRLYHRLSRDFSTKPFDEVISQCRKIIKKYYSCFPLLMQMAVLLCNHHMLAAEPDNQIEILEEAASLCKRIEDESVDMWLARDAVSVEAVCYLMMRRPEKARELLGEDVRPAPGDDSVIAQTYLMEGNMTKADRILQISAYQHLISLTGSLASLLQLQNEKFEEILHRIFAVDAAFELSKLNPNIMAVTYLNAAQGYCMQGNNEKALEILRKYANLCIKDFFPYSLHGDSFFSELGTWFENLDLGNVAPRSEEVIKESIIKSIEENPVFDSLRGDAEYLSILRLLRESFGGK